MELPDEFIKNIRGAFGESGGKFIAELPELISDASHLWGLSDVQPVSNLSYNFVAFAKRGTEDVVLKIGVPHEELTSEIAALRLFNGNGVCRLLECDEARGMLLLERLKPGMMLLELEDDNKATEIGAEVMSNLWRPIVESDSLLSEYQAFIQLSDWFDGFNKLRARFNSGTGPLDANLVSMAEGIVSEFFAEEYIPTLIHGDFHHFNVLSSERGWLAIDPKGVVGPRGYEVGPFLINPWNQSLDGNNFQIKTEKRVSILSERLGLGRDEILRWGIAHAVLSASWSLEGEGDWEYSMRCAEVFSICR